MFHSSQSLYEKRTKHKCQHLATNGYGILDTYTLSEEIRQGNDNYKGSLQWFSTVTETYLRTLSAYVQILFCARVLFCVGAECKYEQFSATIADPYLN